MHAYRVCVRAYTHQCQQESLDSLDSELTQPHRAQHWLGSNMKISFSAGLQHQTFSDKLRAEHPPLLLFLRTSILLKA